MGKFYGSTWNPIENHDNFSSYLQSLNEIYLNFSILGITSIHFRWVQNKKVAQHLTEIWKSIMKLDTFWKRTF